MKEKESQNARFIWIFAVFFFKFDFLKFNYFALCLCILPKSDRLKLF